MTELTTPTVDLAALKAKQQATWASGDYAVVGTTLQIVGERLCETIDLRAGSKVLDVAAGNGNATLAAARRFCDVTSTDYVPALLERGRARAAAERQDIAFSVEDAEALQLPRRELRRRALDLRGDVHRRPRQGRRRDAAGLQARAAPSPWRTGRPRASSARSSRPSAATCRRRRAPSRRRSGARGRRSRRCSAPARGSIELIRRPSPSATARPTTSSRCSAPGTARPTRRSRRSATRARRSRPTSWRCSTASTPPRDGTLVVPSDYVEVVIRKA